MLSLDYGIDVEMRRPTTSFGEKTYPTSATASIRVARTLNPARRINDDGGEAYEQDGVLYVYRGTDIRSGDKVTLPEGDFIVYGMRENDMVNPLDGHDFGVMRLRIEKG